ncbi:hypothetical protein F4777DRAFT_544078 [Nemania sp. FL0916]|nr:hypothetical protein F4777DRAFT_544078 [Nemania sp. FL0916]
MRSSGRFFADMPPRRGLEDNPTAGKVQRFSPTRRADLRAALVHITGVENPPDKACTRCRAGRGTWVGCVTPPQQCAGALRGACANCFHNGSGSKCSFKTTRLSLICPPPKYAS